jgi:hypothetical protein
MGLPSAISGRAVVSVLRPRAEAEGRGSRSPTQRTGAGRGRPPAVWGRGGRLEVTVAELGAVEAAAEGTASAARQEAEEAAPVLGFPALGRRPFCRTSSPAPLEHPPAMGRPLSLRGVLPPPAGKGGHRLGDQGVIVPGHAAILPHVRRRRNKCQRLPRQKGLPLILPHASREGGPVCEPGPERLVRR